MPSRGETLLALLTRDDTVAGRSAGDDLESELDNRLVNFVGIGDDFTPTISKRRSRPGAGWLLTSDGVHLIGRRAIEAILTAALTQETQRSGCFRPPGRRRAGQRHGDRHLAGAVHVSSASRG